MKDVVWRMILVEKKNGGEWLLIWYDDDINSEICIETKKHKQTKKYKYNDEGI